MNALRPIDTKNSGASVLLVHGLNNHSDVLNEIEDFFGKLGFTTSSVALSGHGDAEDKHEADSDAWIQDIANSYCSLKTQNPDQPVYAVGYSLGAAVLTLFRARYPESSFKAAVFLAPAFAPACYVNFLKPLLPLRSFKISLPSFTPKIYRRHDYTPISAFHAVFETVESIKKLPVESDLANQPTLVFLSPKDELISYSGTERWIRKNHLSNWKLVDIHPEPLAPPDYNHLVFDQRSLGSGEWLRVTALIRDFIGK